MKMVVKLVATAIPLLLASCATIVRGVHEEFQVYSNPPGANVTLSTGEIGVTPARFVKERRDEFSVTITKPGFQPQTLRVRSRASAAGAAAGAAGGPLGVAVDAETGAWNSLYPNPVSVELVPLPVVSRPRRVKIPPGDYPVATPSEQAGMVHSPYTRRLYDVRAVPHRALVHDVDANKLFINP